ncbi:hypothetical protein LTS08_002602 [Lithohypha guttulata]|uniref:Uncharacterized protein n=1 Tax=Lithohypha guttulata TaxID=1690604 RepID=A0AAN7YKL1_9EURO|nr:hypothetical protein LTR51_001770 [Lithohypha guttulata]KAK5090496.1 hypothetical protein LTR05_000668 [Lithohypha guttulata]KAK5104710.1 hypothetical protein LTS08_002602 [Lithohypha guttulata]
MSTQQGGEKMTHHFGRGGAGNITTKSDKSPALPPQTTPTLKSRNYTTGRGGTGNIVTNDNPATARIAQDVDVPGIALPEGDVHTGRGGGGNIYKPTEEERQTAKSENEKLRSASFSKDRSGLKGLADKAKEALKGSSTSNKE